MSSVTRSAQPLLQPLAPSACPRTLLFKTVALITSVKVRNGEPLLTTKDYTLSDSSIQALNLKKPLIRSTVKKRHIFGLVYSLGGTWLISA